MKSTPENEGMDQSFAARSRSERSVASGSATQQPGDGSLHPT